MRGYARKNKQKEIVMKARLAVCAWVVTCAITSSATAQPWPSRSISIVVPFSAGGPTDTLVRIISEPMRRFLGQTVVVDNITGGGGTIGVGRVARAPPDGYTVSVGHWGTHVINGAYYKLNYDLMKDLEPVGLFADNPQVVVSNNAVPAKDLKELVAWIKGNPDKVKFGTGGIGGASHIAGIYFMNRVGIKTEYIAYRGGAPAMQALLSGEVNVYLTQVASAVPQTRPGKIRAYMVTAKNRQVAAPEIPTADEAGMPGLYTAVWHGLWVPKGTPRDINMKLNAALVEAMQDPLVRKRFIDLGQEIPAREGMTQQALARHQKAEIDKWWPLMRDAGIKAE
jgi:tripartite-type tricarboxylate transporter receptor subunit TctC